MSERFERLFTRAEAILEGKANGFGEPILHYLAHRKYGPAMLSLACRRTASGKRADLGRLSDPNSSAGMMYRAFRQGEIDAAQNFALTLFYVNDLTGYRRWMRRAARCGDADATLELRKFELRQPFPLARQIKRLRPFRRDGS
ncbi:hypothetical protein H0274_03835 [Altererythrobacter sp. CC-YST694]|uniref:hypothetical protein n=1 Tax=Altererythrobacter sp. CC-YST694 TaxID=2755038 RepID=UPI001D026534|nr:hypothetical protein [Altererythrobacter sp. CC-YST694]MCB5424377.1 hypothetical protein [Altererythrobacter sp. CC-YST694]